MAASSSQGGVHVPKPKMGQAPSGQGGPPGGKKDENKPKKKKFESRGGGVTRRKRKKKGPPAAVKIPQVFPTSKCKLRLLKLERIKDFLLLEHSYLVEK